VGTGTALKIGEKGDADVLLVHARHSEDKFMASGFGSVRKDVMAATTSSVVGPKKIRQLCRRQGRDCRDEEISTSGARFVSRRRVRHAPDGEGIPEGRPEWRRRAHGMFRQVRVWDRC
jgi:ABC-type tungstate transport system permease subunit